MTDASSQVKGKEQLEIERLVDAVANKQAELSNARGTPRYPLNIPIFLCAKSTSGTLSRVGEAWATDISYGGVGMITPYKALVQEVIYANLGAVIGRPLYVRLEILYRKRILSTTYKCGGKFLF